ncbi:MAG TPA: DNA-binding protein [Bacteroidales bacterium]|nr:DNA-binding protein [Bacteroidales bacterium]HCB62610.1 DNA-binding protein [Bacteroidales bacterium]HCY23730.1 DNA-binding protein [Bacteroidales bacterium]
MKNEIIIYHNEDSSTKIEVRLEDETVWLTIEQISALFGRDRTVINRHINNIFKEGELGREMVCAFFALTTQHGAIKGKTQIKNVEHFNLDVIISVGYRVKSKRGTQFRIWANKVLKDYLLKGYAVNNRFERLESEVNQIKSKLSDIDFKISTNLPPNEGIFYEGQVFDAYVLACDIVKTAKKSIILIDNYIDESVLNLLTKRQSGVSATIFTKSISKQLELDIKKHNQQYPAIEVKVFTKSHDRFLIIDNEIVYHIGASLKDLGKNWVAFSKMNLESFEMINKLEL